jgi:hypothetical protein
MGWVVQGPSTNLWRCLQRVAPGGRCASGRDSLIATDPERSVANLVREKPSAPEIGGKLLASHQMIVQFIAAMTPEAGLTIRCELDPNKYSAGVTASDEDSKPSNSSSMNFTESGIAPDAVKRT